MSEQPVIGVSANLMLPDEERRLYKGKQLQYAEAGMVRWVWSHGGHPVMIAMLDDPGYELHLARRLDGLLLTGGADISPELYGETPRRPEWAGQRSRDEHERKLVEAFFEVGKPILGVCRGHQMLNVALGGSLFQDVVEDADVARVHRDQESYDQHRHPVHLHEGTWLSELYGGITKGAINSVHHQAIHEVGDGLEVLAESDDGLIEAVRHRAHPFAVGIQWHPEWVTDTMVGEGILPSTPIIRAFIEACVRPT